ncbi:MAG: hypothetical protein LBD81_01690, partial [Holosporaceae bacterium]|nr:hypothetical protein [Holosporaceae bacterium]
LDDGDDDYSTTLQNLGLEDEGAKKTSNPAEIRQLSVNENIFDTISNNVAAYKRLRKDSKYDDEITEIEEQIVQAKRSENEKDLSKQTKALELIFDSARRLSAVPVYMIKEITTDDYKDILSALIKKEIEEFSKLADGTMNYEFNKLISSLNVKIPFDQKIKIIINNAQQSVSSQSTEEQNVQLSNIRNAANLQNENLSISAKVTRVKNLIESYNRIANTPTTAFLPPDEVIINEMYVNLWNDHVLKLLEEIKPIITEEKERATKLCGKFNEEHETTSVNNSQAKEKLEEEYKKKLKDLESYNGSEKSKARKRKEYEIAHKKELSKLEEETDNKHINALSADSYIADLEELEEEIETTCKREANAESKDDAEKLMDSMANQLVKCLDKCEEIQTELDSKIKSDSAVADFKLPFTVDSIQDDVRIIKESLVSCKKTVVKKIEQIK